MASLFALALAGCSALIDPDPSLLGGGADGGGVDAVRPDAPATCLTPCDDGIDCTADACTGGECVATPDDRACGAGERCQAGVGCVSRLCRADPDCNDRAFCNGEERCAPMSPGADPVTGCVAGDPPACADDYTCTADACDEDADACVATPDPTMCDDGIACTVDTCGGGGVASGSGCVSTPDDSLCAASGCMVGARCDPDTGGCFGGTPPDCRDGNPCTDDFCEDTTGACVHPLRDADGDGHTVQSVPGRACGGDDCDDTDPGVSPDATEICNGRDDDCSGTADEGCVAPPEDCTTAQAIVLTDGMGTAGGRLSSFRSDYGTGCGRTGGPDAVYYVDITAASDVTIDTIGSDTDTVLAVGTTCSGDGFRMACDDDIDSGVVTDSRIWVHRAAPPPAAARLRLYILVDGFDAGATGDYVVNVRVTSPPAGRSCSGAVLDISGGGTLVGVIPPAAPVGTERGSCQTDGEIFEVEDIVSFHGPADGDVSFQAFSRDFVPDLYVRGPPCGTGTELACDLGGSAGGGLNVARVDVATAVGTTHYLFIDGGGSGDGYNVSYEP